jgi:hypothetical protein
MKNGERRGNAAPWKTRENQTQVSLVFPRPWKSLRDFHIPTAPMTMLPFRTKTHSQNHRKEPNIHDQPDFTPSGSFLD